MCAADIKISSRESRGEWGWTDPVTSLSSSLLHSYHYSLFPCVSHPFVNMFSGAPITSSLTSTSCTSLGNTTTTTLQLRLIRQQAQVWGRCLHLRLLRGWMRSIKMPLYVQDLEPIRATKNTQRMWSPYFCRKYESDWCCSSVATILHVNTSCWTSLLCCPM